MNSSIRDWIAWPGTHVLISLFAAFPQQREVPEQPSLSHSSLLRVSRFLLEDEFGVLPEVSIATWDLKFSLVPEPLESNLRQLILWALDSGATVAWCATEGNFTYDDLLSASTADGVYALGTSPDRIEVVSESDGTTWRKAVDSAQAELLKGSRVERVKHAHELGLILATLRLRAVDLAERVLAGEGEGGTTRDEAAKLGGLWRSWVGGGPEVTPADPGYEDLLKAFSVLSSAAAPTARSRAAERILHALEHA